MDQKPNNEQGSLGDTAQGKSKDCTVLKTPHIVLKPIEENGALLLGITELVGKTKLIICIYVEIMLNRPSCKLTYGT